MRNSGNTLRQDMRKIVFLKQNELKRKIAPLILKKKENTPSFNFDSRHCLDEIIPPITTRKVDQISQSDRRIIEEEIPGPIKEAVSFFLEIRNKLLNMIKEANPNEISSICQSLSTIDSLKEEIYACIDKHFIKDVALAFRVNLEKMLLHEYVKAYSGRVNHTAEQIGDMILEDTLAFSLN